MSEREKLRAYLVECDEWATAEYLQADAVIFLQARLGRVLKEPSFRTR